MLSAKARRRQTKEARAAYCTGCDTTFPKMHLLFNHRRNKHCGGRYLPPAEREMVDKLRLEREAMFRCIREEDST